MIVVLIPSGARLRLSLDPRILFVLTVVAGGLITVAYKVGFEEALGIALTLSLLTWAVRCRRRGVFLVLRGLPALLGLGILWMVAVDASWLYEVCPDCNLGRRGIGQYRLFRIPLHERITCEDCTAVSRIAADLGVPCSHRFGRTLIVRYWGLFFPARPYVCGIMRLTEDEWYDEDVANTVRAKALASPGLAKEFHQKILVEHDNEYRHRFCEELIQLKAGDVEQPKPPAPDLNETPRERGI